MQKLFKRKSLKVDRKEPIAVSHLTNESPSINTNSPQKSNRWSSKLDKKEIEPSIVIQKQANRLIVTGNELFPYLHTFTKSYQVQVKWNTMELLNVLLANPEVVREVTLSDEFIDPSVLRSIKWRSFLGILPENGDEWVTTTTAYRTKYKRSLKKMFEVGKRNRNDNTSITDYDKEWLEYESSSTELKEIKEDVLRTYSSDPFFTDNQTFICRILSVFSFEHPEFKYMQGMNELIAPIVYCVWKDAKYVEEVGSILKTMKISENSPFRSVVSEVSTDPTTFLSFLCSNEGREADAYTLFCALMKECGNWFDAQFVSDGHFSDIHVLVKCQQILLRVTVKDNELSKYLKKLRLDPPVYLIKWVRILFAQIFPLDELLHIWDNLFAYSQNCELLEHICTAILVSLRENIIGSDHTDAMNTLFTFNGKDHSKLIVALALNSAQTSIPFFYTSDILSETFEKQTRDYIKNAESFKYLTPSKAKSPNGETLQQQKHDECEEDEEEVEDDEVDEDDEDEEIEGCASCQYYRETLTEMSQSILSIIGSIQDTQSEMTVKPLDAKLLKQMLELHNMTLKALDRH